MNSFLPSYLSKFVFVALLLTIANCGKNTKETQSQPADDNKTVTYIDSVVIELAGVDSMTVLQLLEQSHRVKKEYSAIGTFVQAIDSIENGGGAYWMYSVNDSMSQVACDKYVTHKGDRIKWMLRKFVR